MKKCLVVDDSQTVRKIIRRILEDFSFDCEEAEDGKQALEKCQSHMPELIMLDWNMPNVNGLEFLKMLRALENGNIPQVVFCTTENTMEFIKNGIEAGANEYIMKPFDKSVVESKLIQLGILQ